MSEQLAVSFNNQPIIVDTEFAVSDQVLIDAGKNITSFKIINSTETSTDTPVVSLCDSERPGAVMVPGDGEISVSGNRQMFGDGKSLLYIAEYLATAVQSARDGVFLTHAAATYIPDDERSILILGEKGAGKTTLSIILCRDLGHLLVGNDQVYFGGTDMTDLSTYSGNKWFNVRNTAIESDSYLADLIGKKPKELNVPSWNAKQRVEPESIGIKVHEGKTPISEIVHVRIDPTQTEAHTAVWKGVQKNLILHERLGRHILGQATPFQDDRGNYLGSLPLINPEASMARRDALTRILINKGITELFAPNSSQAADYFRGNQ